MPAKTAPEAERLAAWEKLRPVSGSEKLTPAGSELHLRDGTVITEPSGLLPAFEPGSRAAELARASMRSGANRDAAAAVAIGTGAGSVAFAVFAFVPLSPRVSVGEGQVWFALAALSHAGVALVHLAVWAVLAVVSGNERDLVFDDYEASLRARLAIPTDVR